MQDYSPDYFEKLEKAAMAGDTAAMLQLSILLLGVPGSPVKRDPTAAVRWLRRAADEGGHAYAMELLGMEAESRVKQSPEASDEAAAWYARALDAYDRDTNMGVVGAQENAEALRKRLVKKGLLPKL
jgi:TPR repeat protein